MAIALEFIDFIVPIALIREKYPGGWEQCLKDHENLIGGRVWFDEHLLRDGAMSPDGIGALVDEWTELGFEPTEERDGQRVWKDCCVVESLFGRPTLPCDWLEIGEDECTAYLKERSQVKWPADLGGVDHFKVRPKIFGRGVEKP